MRVDEIIRIAVRRLRYGRGIAGPLKPRAADVAFYGQFVGEGGLAFDVGANVGDKTAVCRALGARVVAFEPQPLCLRLLNKRFAGDAGVTVVAEGISDQAGVLPMSVCDSAKTISTFNPEWKEGRFSDFRWSSQIEVPVITLDEAIARYGVPDFIKIDVEGFEEQVLRGLSQPAGSVSFEFVKEYAGATGRCLDLLSALGYREFNCALGSETQYVFEQWTSAAEVLAFITQSEDQLLQGDIYARAGTAGGSRSKPPYSSALQ